MASAFQPIGVPGDWLVMKRKVPPVRGALDDEGTGLIEATGEVETAVIGAAVVGAVVMGFVVLGITEVTTDEAGTVVEGWLVEGVEGEVLQPITIKAATKRIAKGINNFFTFSS